MSWLDIPIAVILIAAVDRAAWDALVAIAGPAAVFYVAILIFLEISALAKGGSNNSGHCL